MSGETSKVLVLEDSSTQARLITRMFESVGLGTEVYNSARAFQNVTKSSDSKIIAALVDVHFGDVNGLTLLEPIRRLWPDIPIIVMTANKTDDYRVLADSRRLGINLVLPKPFSKEHVAELVKDIEAIRNTGVRRRHVVIIDDSVATRRIASAVLSAVGYRVSAFEDGLDAIHRLSFDFVDVVLTDLNMPEMSGDEIIDLVRDVWGRVGIVAMSGDLKLCKNRALVDGLVPKPFDAPELCRAIELAMPSLHEPIESLLEGMQEDDAVETGHVDLPEVYELDC